MHALKCCDLSVNKQGPRSLLWLCAPVWMVHSFVLLRGSVSVVTGPSREKNYVFFLHHKSSPFGGSCCITVSSSCCPHASVARRLAVTGGTACISYPADTYQPLCSMLSKSQRTEEALCVILGESLKVKCKVVKPVSWMQQFCLLVFSETSLRPSYSFHPAAFL